MKNELEAWRSAVIDALVVSGIYSAKHEANPVAALNELLAWHQAVALDPQVSAGAAKFAADRDAAIARAEKAEAECERLRQALQGAMYFCVGAALDSGIPEHVREALNERAETISAVIGYGE